MPNATIPLTSFTGGEWSPRLHGRVDIQKYSTACEVLQNMVIYPHGGVTRRMGLEYIEDAKSDIVRLIPFEYNREQAYVLEFGAGYIRFYRDGGQVQEGAGPRELVTPYAAEHIPQLAYTQSADVLYIVHGLYPPMKVTRSGADVFSIQVIAFTNPIGTWTTGNYPSSVVLFQSRLVFAGLPKEPHVIYMSEQFIYESMKLAPPTGEIKATDGLQIKLSSNQVNAIQWMVAGKKLMVGTTGGEWTISGAGDASIHALNIKAERESNFGSSTGRVQMVGNGVIYPSRDGKKIREMTYRYESDGFESPELSLFSEHLTRSGIKDFDFAQNPDGVLWVVLNSGDFIGMTYLKAHEVSGWHRHQTDGDVLSVCTIEGPNNTQTWFAVYRNGKTRIEKMADPFDGDTADDIKCAYLDSFLTYEGSPVDDLYGLDHLEGKDVDALCDGQYVQGLTVTSGHVKLPFEASKIVIGLPYQWKLRPLRLEGGSPRGFSQGKMKSVDSVVVRLERSSGISHVLPGELLPTPVPARSFGDNFNEAVDLYTGDIEIKLWPNWDRKGQLELTGDSAFPVSILMIGANITVNE